MKNAAEKRGQAVMTRADGSRLVVTTIRVDLRADIAALKKAMAAEATKSERVAKGPSIAQMAVRSLAGHRKALEAVGANRPQVGHGATAGEIKGARVVYKTLRRWGCLEGSPAQLTSVGRDLLARLQEKAS